MTARLNKESFIRHYTEIYEDMYRYARIILRTKEDAEDAVADAVAEAYKSRNKLKDEAKFKQWIFAVLRNTCKHHMRKYYRNESSLEEYEEMADDATDSAILIWDAIKALSDEERQIIALKLFAGYTSEEVAKALKLNPSTVRSKQRRALQRLREEF